MFFCKASDALADDNWPTVFKNELLTVDVEKALYEKPGHHDFFIHVHVANLSAVKLGVDDLKGPWDLIYPWRWNGSGVPYLETVEGRMTSPGEVGCPKKYCSQGLVSDWEATIYRAES